MKILGIDTSTTLFSICLSEDEQLLYELKGERTCYQKSRDAGLFEAVQYLLKNLAGARLDAIAIAIGPGMFTSLRVGLALAKGFHLSMDIPICGVNTLEVIARSFPFWNQNKEFICAPLMEAFQNELFVAFYNHKKSLGQELVLKPRDFIHYVEKRFKNKTIFAIGPGVRILRQCKEIKDARQIVPLDSPIFYPSASKVVSLALSRIKAKKFDDPEFLEPHYLKKTSAELSIKKR